MKVRTSVKAGRARFNHNETLVREAAKAKGVRVKTNLKAGRRSGEMQHNETLLRDAPQAEGVKVRTNVKAGMPPHNHNETLVRDRG